MRILDAVESDQCVSQRSLASDLGIAVGLTNLLIKRLVRKGCVRVNNIKPNRVRYCITPTGLAEKARMSRAYFERSVDFYSQTRDRIRERFMSLSSQWVAPEGAGKRIAFYGAGEVAEIGYICLAETDLHLVGVIDPVRRRPFFGLEVSAPEDVTGLQLGGQSFQWLAVMSFGDVDTLRDEIRAMGFRTDRVFWM